MTRQRLPLAIAAGLFAGAFALPAAADVQAPTTAERTYMQYHQGVYAAVQCRDAVFSQSDYQILESRILDRAGTGMSAGPRLELIEEGKDEINSAMAHAGCDADEVEAALVRFDELRGYQTGEAPKQ